eukprot:TRINITY_DN43243_c0_g1_i1.p1 TRINITY_DN43243_c0_g1~~TRINITY_DN43243_c0_g1_i1.p1  ORF type:complete len:168 (-),score=18.10 TRINITY_DN43243_c0_g1_i1:39-542(-)
MAGAPTWAIVLSNVPGDELAEFRLPQDATIGDVLTTAQNFSGTMPHRQKLVHGESVFGLGDCRRMLSSLVQGAPTRATLHLAPGARLHFKLVKLPHPQSVTEYRTSLLDIYLAYRPAPLTQARAKVDELLRTYPGEEDDLYQAVVLNFCNEPVGRHFQQAENKTDLI